MLSFVYSTVSGDRAHTGFPVIALSERGLGPKDSWMKHGRATLLKGIKQCNDPFQILTGTGHQIVLPSRFADELRIHEDLNVSEVFKKDFFTSYPGFEAFRAAFDGLELIQETIREKLTQSLGLIVGDMVEETTASVHDYFGEDPDWHALDVNKSLLGLELCRDKRWLKIAQDYTVDGFIVAFTPQMVPAVLRPLAHWVLPHWIRVRREYRDAKKVLLPETQPLIDQAKKALAAGQKSSRSLDSMSWLVEVSRGRPVDYVTAQLALTVPAIHTTLEAIVQALLDICTAPDIAPALRKEVMDAISEHGWSKTALQQMRLMDSLIKESRGCIHPTLKQITLSDGTVLPAGSRIVLVPAHDDPNVFEHPDVFDPCRFLREREKPGQQHSWQHVSTSAHHTAFGFGRHACPGRFFASNEIKIVMAHMLMKYDWRVDGDVPQNVEFQGAMMTPPHVVVQLRRRREEIDIDVAGVGKAAT
ncbi:hypothetical protein LTR10_005934 [Elasticomyces elasticus]|nr:hypothetical protein LTR10_005934 [Elasticomyces elasticus]KAK4965135.1 hypothetical protein LTR42_012556 [Elasticomyces elasticus]